MIIGYTYGDYSYKRNIIGIVPGAEYKEVYDFYLILNILLSKLNHMTKRNEFSIADIRYKFNDFNINKVNIFHFFNIINYGRVPWVTTFETILPRFVCTLSGLHGTEPNSAMCREKWKIQRALEALSRDSCKRIIALSDCNANMQRVFLRFYPEYKESIERKLMVLHPPQNVFITRYSEKNLKLEGKIKFIFVGASFFRKGGVEVIETLKSLREQYNYEIELTIVSSLDIDNYATKEGPDDVSKTRQFIYQNSSWINYFTRLPNKKVLELMKESHIGLLPTYADTYGYSVLELQATGCPVITTDVRALPEINNNDKGWIIKVLKNPLGEAIYITREDRRIISKSIRNGLEQAVHEIFNDRTVIIRKSEKSIAEIEENHSIREYTTRMIKIYEEAIN